MAKAKFEGERQTRRTGPGADDYMVTPRRRVGQFDLLEEGPGGELQKSGRGYGGAEIPLSGVTKNRRMLYTNDLSDTEMSRLEQAHQEWQAGTVQRLRDHKTSESANRFGQQFSHHFGEPGYPDRDYGIRAGGPAKGETFDQTADRMLEDGRSHANYIAQQLGNPGQNYGNGWYFEQNRGYREGIKSADPEVVDRGIYGGSSMSPQNSPEREMASGIEMTNAELHGGKFKVPDNASSWVSPNPKNKRRLDPKWDGREVSFSELDDEAVKVFKDKDFGEAFPEMQGAGGTAWDKVRLGGSEITAGMDGIRGKHPDLLRPPLAAPKVAQYGKNNAEYESPSPEHEADYIRQGENLLGGRRESRSQAFRMTDELADYVLDRHGRGTDNYNPDDRAVQEVEANRGRLVDANHMHPANVGHLSHRDVEQIGGADVRHAAQSSSNRGTVIDTWVNGGMNGLPHATLIPKGRQAALDKAAAKGKTASPVPVSRRSSAFKVGGTEDGYWRSKSLADDTPILDVNADGSGNSAIGPKTLMHAAGDHIMRSIAEKSDAPSTAAQESIVWSAQRATAGKDDQYEAATKKRQG